MSKLFKGIIAGILAVIVCAMGTPIMADIDQSSGAISISTIITGSTSLSISYLETATGAVGTGALSFDLSGLDLSDGSTLWAVADECFLVDYSSNYSWGIRIITDNDDVVDAMAGSDVAISDYVAANMLALDGDGVYDDASYSGMLSGGDIQDVIDGTLTTADLDPTNRATIAWMADSEWSTDYQSVLPVSTFAADGSIEDDNVGDCWDITDVDQWAYIGDKNDDSFNDEIYTGSTTSLEYSIVATGAAGANGSLVPFTPAQADSDGDSYTDMEDLSADDGDIVIYLASRFAATNWGDPTTPFPYLLEPDTYTTSLYIELIHE